MTKVIKNMIAGAGQMLDFSGGCAIASNRARISRLRGMIAKSDQEAIAGDFRRVGENIHSAIAKYSERNGL